MTSKLLTAALVASLCSSQGFSKEQTSFSVTVDGRGDRALVLIPGLECPADIWRSFIDRYRSSYEIHAISIAGFAGEPAVPGLTLADVERQIVEYIQRKKLKKPILIGHSLGGFLAFWVGTSEPDLLGGIISIDGLPFLPAVMNGASDAERMRSLYSSLNASQLEAMSRVALQQMISDSKQVDIVAHWAGESDPSFVGEAIYDLMTTDLRPELRKLRAPVLMIGAGKAFAQDQAQFSKVRAAYEDQLKAASDHKLVMAERALHFVMLDDPEFLFRVIDQFLAVRR